MIVLLDPGLCSYRRMCLLHVVSRPPRVTDADGKSLLRVYERTSTATLDVEGVFWAAPRGGR